MLRHFFMFSSLHDPNIITFLLLKYDGMEGKVVLWLELEVGQSVRMVRL